MTKSKRQKNQDDLKELLDLLEKLVEIPTPDAPSAIAIRSAYRLKLFKNSQSPSTRVSLPPSECESDALWDMLHRERTTPLDRVLLDLLEDKNQ